MKSQIIFGTSVLENELPQTGKPLIGFSGVTLTGQRNFGIDADALSKHILLIGGAGCGKTNAFFYALNDIRNNMNENDVSIIFDTKGEFYDLFKKDGDYVIGNSLKFREESFTWNIFDEILADGWEDDAVSINAKEISAGLFYGRGSSTQPFFCNAARDIFTGILIHFIRSAKRNPEKWMNRLNNSELLKAFRRYDINLYKSIFKYYYDLRYLLTYFGDGNTGQALGVFGELNSMISEYFVGILAEHNPDRKISMRNAVRNKGGKAIFVEYDLSIGEILTPVYRLLIDQALKEALGRNVETGKVYLIADEFKLLPKLQHIDDALNFGRGLGVSVIAGIQSINQIYDIYGQDKGSAISSGFGSVFAFHANDSESREYITRRFGKNIMVFNYNDLQKNLPVRSEREGNTIEEWEQMQLGVGQAAIGIGYNPPFLFKFDRFED